MLSVINAECLLCRVSQISPLRWVSVNWMPLFWMSFCWVPWRQTDLRRRIVCRRQHTSRLKAGTFCSVAKNVVCIQTQQLLPWICTAIWKVDPYFIKVVSKKLTRAYFIKHFSAVTNSCRSKLECLTLSLWPWSNVCGQVWSLPLWWLAPILACKYLNRVEGHKEKWPNIKRSSTNKSASAFYSIFVLVDFLVRHITGYLVNHSTDWLTWRKLQY
jgi:hypothetical protein